VKVNKDGQYEGVVKGRTVHLARVTSVIGAFFENWDAVPMENLEKAARFGTKVHNATEYDDLGTLIMSKLDPLLWPCLKAWRKFKIDFKVEIEEVEPVIYNVRYGFAGRLDRIGLVNGIRSIIDIKTCKYKAISHDLQVAAYQGAWNELNPRKKALRRHLVELRRDSTYRVTEIKGAGDYAVFLSAVALYNWRVKNS